MSKKVIINVLFLVLAVFLTIATTYKKVEVFNKSELNNLSCGWPVQYISSGYDESVYDPPYPWKKNCIGFISKEWGDPVDICWECFIFNVVFFYLLVLAFLYSGNIIAEEIQRKKQDHIEN